MLARPPASTIPFRLLGGAIRDGMKSFSNRRWANREVWYNVLGGTRECLQRARVAEGPSGWFDDFAELTAPIRD